MNRPQPFRLESVGFSIESLRLLQIVHASKSIQMHCKELLEEANRAPKKDKKTDDGNLSEVKRILYLLRGEEAEANRILLTLAVVVRNGLDQAPLIGRDDQLCSVLWEPKTQFEGQPPRPFPETPIQIWKEFQRQNVESTGLGVKDTCNKIIHAQGVEWSRTETFSSHAITDTILGRHLDGFVFLYGTRQVKNKESVWICMLRVDAFCTISSQLV